MVKIVTSKFFFKLLHKNKNLKFKKKSKTKNEEWAGQKCHPQNEELKIESQQKKFKTDPNLSIKIPVKIAWDQPDLDAPFEFPSFDEKA